MTDKTAGEPIGGEAAIGWHLRQMDFWDYQESCADAMDCGDLADDYRTKRLAHAARLAELEAAFPETARVARADYEIECRQQADINADEPVDREGDAL